MTDTVLRVTKVTGKGDNKIFWYNGGEPPPRKMPPRGPRKPYRMDPNKARLYAAEYSAFLRLFGSSESGGAKADLPEYDDLRAYVSKIQRDKWFVRMYGRRHFIVGDGRGLSKAVGIGYGNRITIARDSRARWIVLHEIAHCLTPAGKQHHGPEYAQTYLKLVGHFLGKAARKALYDAFRAHKVRMRVRKTRRRALTPEERAALTRRLEVGKARAQAERERGEREPDLTPTSEL